jgi:hypothetical protein
MKNILITLALVLAALQGCDKRVISPNVRHGVSSETYASNIKLALLSELDPSVTAPTDADLNYASERLSENEKFDILVAAYREIMENPSFWDKTHPKDSVNESEWETYRQSSEEGKQERAEQAARNYLGLMRH